MKNRHDRIAPKPPLPTLDYGASLPSSPAPVVDSPTGETRVGMNARSEEMTAELHEHQSQLGEARKTIAALEEQVRQALAAGTQSIAEIALADIDDSPYQPRLQYNSAKLDELSQTLGKAGQKEPIIVRRIGKRFETISGHRRRRAAANIGWTKIKAVVVEMDDDMADQSTVVANESREGLSDFERAKAYQKAVDKGWCASDQREIGRFFGVSQSFVSRCLGMLAMPTRFVQIFEERPEAVNSDCAADVRDLLEAYPLHQEVIFEAVQRVARNELKQSALKAWVNTAIKNISGEVNKGGWTVATDATGKEVFASKLSGKAITIRIQPKLDNEKVHAEIAKLLKTLAEETEKN